jgi:hypothetical protein
LEPEGLGFLNSRLFRYTQTFRDFVKKLLTLDPEKRPDISAVMTDLDKMYPA